jgi:hypothetical protein
VPGTWRTGGSGALTATAADVVHVATTDGAHGQVYAAVHFGFDDAGLITRIEEYAHFVPAGRKE